jgi:hypothetical protein
MGLMGLELMDRVMELTMPRFFYMMTELPMQLSALLEILTME